MSAKKTLTVEDADGDLFTLSPAGPGVDSENVLVLDAGSDAIFLTRADVDELIDFLREFATPLAPVRRIMPGAPTFPGDLFR